MTRSVSALILHSPWQEGSWDRAGRGALEKQGAELLSPGPSLCPQDSLGCRLVFLLMQYCVAANYYWLLVEGVYLYMLLALSVFSEQRIFRRYLSIGWGKAPFTSPPPQPVHGGWETKGSYRLPPGSPLVLRTLQGSGQGPRVTHCRWGCQDLQRVMVTLPSLQSSLPLREAEASPHPAKHTTHAIGTHGTVLKYSCS